MITQDHFKRVLNRVGGPGTMYLYAPARCTSPIIYIVLGVDEDLMIQGTNMFIHVRVYSSRGWFTQWHFHAREDEFTNQMNHFQEIYKRIS